MEAEAMHFVGCSEWAKAWEEKYGRGNLDATTLRNLDEMKHKGCASCCKGSR